MECKEDSSGYHHWIGLIHKFLQQFGWLADSFVLDFYQDNHWSKLPPSWQGFLPSLSPEELADVLNLKVNKYNCWGEQGVPAPLSLISFRAAVQLLSLSREKGTTSIPLKKNPETCVHNDDKIKEFEKLLHRHVKPKKRHEVVEYCNIVSTIAGETGTERVFDVGSGLGHLSRYLTYGCGLKLTSIDCVEEFGENAGKFDAQLESFLAKKVKDKDGLPGSLPPPPTHLTLKLDLDKHEKLLQLEENFGIIGLHTCGNLGPIILHNYVNSPAKFVVSVGCCYMKVDEKGFPLSHFVKQLGLHLSYEALEVACHFIEQYVERLKQGKVTKLMTHAYRAAIETLLIKHFNIKRAGLKGVRGCELMSFEEYAMKATRDFDKVQLTKEVICNERIDNMLKDWYKVVLFYSLRLLMANVIETAVILDRVLFLKEKLPRSSVKICKLFDARLSPRCFAVVGERQLNA